MPIKADIFKSKTADTLKLGGKSKEYLENKLNAHLTQEIMKSVGASGEKMEAAVSALKLHYKDVKDLDLKTLIQEKVLPALRETPSFKKELDGITTQDLAPYPSTKIGDLLYLDKPFRDNPVFAEDARRVKVMELASIVKLDENAAARLADQELNLGQAGDPEWQKLVSEGAISGEQARDLRLAAELAGLTDDNFKLVKALKTDRVTSLKDFAALDQREWLKLLKTHSAEAPAGETLEDYAGNMAANLERTYPSQCFFKRIALRDRGKETGLTGVIQPLLTKNSRLFGSGAAGEINWEGIPDGSRKAIEEGLAKLGALANTYRHLGVADILNNPALEPVEKQKHISDEIARLETFHRDNPDLDLRLADFFEKKLASAGPGFTRPVWDGIAPKDRPKVRKQLMAYQRVMNIAGGSDAAGLLLTKGLDSAFAVSSLTESQLAGATGLPEEQAAGIHARARGKMVRVAHGSEAIRDIGRGNFTQMYVSNTDSLLVNELKEIDGYDDLFGSQNYCDCEHCKSIFSPAAYFVDLMYFIDTHISTMFYTPKPDHPLFLKQRRPDLWNLQLTCENTNTPIPYLEIVNDILEQYLEPVMPWGNIYKHLSLQRIAFSLPFHLPLEEIRLYLGHFETSLPKLFQLLRLEPAAVAREQLGLSNEELDAVVIPDPNRVVLRFGNPARIDEMEVQLFLKYTGLTREELDQLTAANFVVGDSLFTVEKEEDPNDIQGYQEKITGLDKKVLDRTHRFVRLWRQLPWTMAELDLVLDSLKGANLAVNLDQDAVVDIAALLALQERLKLSVEEMCGLFHLIPVTPVRAGEPSLFERLFQTNGLSLPGGGVTFYTTSVSTGNTGNNTVPPGGDTMDQNLPALLAGLGVSQAELLHLLGFLKNQLQVGSDGSFTLDRRKLSLLYRHARLARALKIPVEILLNAVGLVIQPPDTHVVKIEQVEALADFLDWLKSSPFSMEDLQFILKEQPVNSPSTVTSLVEKIQQDQALYFDGKMLAQVDGVSEETSEDIINQMVKVGFLATSLDNMQFRLTTAYKLTQDFKGVFEAVKVGDQVYSKGDDIRKCFNSYHPQAILPPYLAALFNIPTGLLNTEGPFSKTDRAESAFITALNTTIDNGAAARPQDLGILRQLLQEIKWLQLIDRLQLNAADLAFMAGQPDIFKITNLQQPALDTVKLTCLYRNLPGLNEDTRPAVHRLLSGYLVNTSFTRNDAALLSKLTGKDQILIQSVFDSLELPANPLEAMKQLAVILDVCSVLGVNGTALSHLAKTTFEDLQAARDLVYAAFKSKYDSGEAWRKVIEPYEERLNMKKRDALCSCILAKEPQLKFKDRSELYSYFLIDVEMSGCSRISKVRAAISSLQLYVHRCLMNLEQSQDGTFIVPPNNIPVDQWEWRKNYRMWEANRKVFVYPENYIEPELRDNKSPFFKELEDELLQQKITSQSAENAYKKYLTQLAEVGRLKIAGSYYSLLNDTLYLFGRTPSDPPQFYFRKFVPLKAEWTPWEKIELSINADCVSALLLRSRLYLFWVEINTKEVNKLINGSSEFYRYEHNLMLMYSYQNESGKWTPPQRIEGLHGIVSDRTREQRDYFMTAKTTRKVYPKTSGRKADIFYLRKFCDDTNYRIVVTCQELDLYQNHLVDSGYPRGSDVKVIKMYDSGVSSGKAALGLTDTRECEEPLLDDQAKVAKKDGLTLVTNEFSSDSYKPDITIVHSRFGDFVVKLGEQQFLIRKAENSILTKREMIRLTTSLPDRLGTILVGSGLEAFLTLGTQKIKEAPLGIEFTSPAELMLTGENLEHLPFNGPYGTYFQELFFHIPALIANHLNANQKFKEAKQWYEKIFNPTATENSMPARPTDRNWQYLEFRDQDLKKLKEILSDQAAIEQYKIDPFNPHAIARLRLSAYQKAVVMKYIDNLLDWGDSLFARDTMESINEATMLYVLAADILGPRPVKLGKCNTAPARQMTYAEIGPAIKDGSEFVISLENWIDSVMVSSSIKKGGPAAVKTYKKPVSIDSYKDMAEAINNGNLKDIYEDLFHNDFLGNKRPPFDAGRLRYTGQVFCVPPNETLLEYWDRVADRLFKIRNCMNIKGIRRQLALFDPPIDPAALVKARAAGLSLEDILSSLYDAVPPYRFTYLIEKAKSLAATVQGFGSALLGALEKKDTEELTLLRSVHEQNILKLTKEIKKRQINETKAQLQNLITAKVNVENRKNHYDSLIDTGLIKWETTEQIAKHTGTISRGIESGLRAAAAIAYLVPNLGSPFAITYGGKQMGDAAKAWSDLLNNVAVVADCISASAGLEASFQRREQEWKLQQKLADQEMKQMDQQIAAAAIRLEITEKDLEIHEASMEQTREVYDFYKNKFTNLGLYNYLSTSLHRLYREAYNLAYDLAKMAERAYRFERDDDTVFIESDNWQADRAGLLAGERLLLQLNRMEKYFLEINVRDYEITQSFSMQQINPSALLQLKETGACDFTIPELFFDLFYPGQYRRVIKSTQLTIPCVTGPYTNVSCKLSLTSSQIRKEPKLGAQYLLNGPQQLSASVATSSANNDGGLFELNFRDERYMPFEGAGAVSTWRLELPGVFRPFNYETISDVIFHISYTAKDDGLFKQNLETVMQQEMMDYAANYGLFRLFSLRHEFPTQWHQLLNPAGAEQKTSISLDKAHFPYLLWGENLDMTEVRVILQHEEGSVIDTGSLTLKIKELTAVNWATAPGELKQAIVQDLKGTPLGDWAIQAGAKGLDKKAVKNIFLLLKYTIS